MNGYWALVLRLARQLMRCLFDAADVAFHTSYLICQVEPSSTLFRCLASPTIWMVCGSSFSTDWNALADFVDGFLKAAT